ncbi:MAG: NAD-dependent epimerase/dehydratase family protein [Bacteroidales bacterium]|nr:NAD-dependent epimerase/dehydratase family protein [Bacteroidales bacterium]MCF8402551.1 NAD-dependent epimerase/dehydratase family protein [Bacteroidales bacterium]
MPTNIKSNKVLITGINGHIGSFLLRKLQNNGIEVVGLDLKKVAPFSNIPFIEADITQKGTLDDYDSLLKECNILVHLASRIEGSQDIISDAIPGINLNVIGTMNLLQKMPNLKSIIYASTYMVYGKPARNPVMEDDIKEPVNIYGISKLITENYLKTYANLASKKLKILRFMGVYGPGTPQTTRAIPNFIKLIANNKAPTLYGKGEVSRNHIFIDDAVEAIWLSILSEKSGVFNIGGESSINNLGLVDIINEVLGKKIIPTIVDSNAYDFISNISLAGKELGFYPKTTFQQGIAAEIESLQKSGII